METLMLRAISLREAQQKFLSTSVDIVSTLDSFDHRVSSLDEAMSATWERTKVIRKADKNISRTLDSAEAVLGQLDLMKQADAKLLKGPGDDLDSYIEAMDQLRSILCFFSSNESFKKNDAVLNSVDNLISKAIQQLEDNFESHLSLNSKPVEPDDLFEHQAKSLEAAVCTPQTLSNPGIIPLLHNLALQLVHAGHQQQCLNIYRKVRAPALEESLKKLGVERLSKDDVQRMQWKALEAKIGDWIHFMRIVVKLLFAGERKVCDQIFEGIDTLKDRCFVEVTTNSAAMLLSFGEAIAECKRSPEKLFVLLDMYEVMQELQSEIEMIFKGKACFEMRKSVLSLMKHIAQVAYDTLHDFEEAVEKDVSKLVGPDGAIHPLTSYVVSYVKFFFDYQSTLKQIFQEFETGSITDNHLATVTKRILQTLQSNLDGKSKQYNDPALSYLFLMNNTHHMVKTVRKSEVKGLLGADWVQRHRRIVQQNANQYKRIAWSEIITCLSTQELSTKKGSIVVQSDGRCVSGVSRSTVKERFKSFSMQFDELLQRQSQWEVADAELRETLRLSISEILVPAYRSFVTLCGHLVEKSRNPQKYIKYTPEDVEAMLGDTFKAKQPQ